MSEQRLFHGFLPPVIPDTPTLLEKMAPVRAHEKRAIEHDRKLVFGRNAELAPNLLATEHQINVFIGAVAAACCATMPEAKAGGYRERRLERADGGTMRLVSNEAPPAELVSVNQSAAAALDFRMRRTWRWRPGLRPGILGLLPGRYVALHSVYIEPQQQRPHLRLWLTGQSWFNRHIEAHADRPASRFEVKAAVDTIQTLVKADNQVTQPDKLEE